MLTIRGAACAVIVLVAAACGTATSEEQKPNVYERPGIRDYEHISAVTSDHRASVFYERVTWANIHAWSDAWWWGQVGAWSGASVASQVRQVAEHVQSSAPRSSSGGASGACSGGPIPHSQMLNESGGDPNAVGPTQPDGSHPVGCWQTLDSHYRSGGTCAGLSYSNVDGQRECANRIYKSSGPGAWTAPVG